MAKDRAPRSAAPLPLVSGRPLTRRALLPEERLPETVGLLAEGRDLARQNPVVPGAFLRDRAVGSEIEYKRRMIAEGRTTLHAQIGYRDPAKSERAYAEVWSELQRRSMTVDRYGICLDWSMGYPPELRRRRPKGTGLILERPEQFADLTAMAPVAPHFGDFVMGMPGAVENTTAALAAGSTTIGNLGQYFCFRLPHWDDEVATTAATVKALALCAAQPVPILIHSNLDDGFASIFTDLCCSLGSALVEQYIVEDLIGGHIGHGFGHTFSDPLTRLAFQQALARTSRSPGTMLYGNTTSYRSETALNFASLASYLLVDAVGQRWHPTGHGLNPVPVTEAERIPDIDEVVEAQLVANRLIEHAELYVPLLDRGAVDAKATEILEGGRAFRDAVLAGLGEAGIDIADPFEMLLALRRLGARRLELLFGPGTLRQPSRDRREPVIAATTIRELESRAEALVAGVDGALRTRIAGARFKICIATTDVHEYGKILLENVLKRLDVTLVDAGVSADPDTIAERARAAGADAVAISTYNGVAKDFIRRLQGELAARGLDLPLFVGGRLNQIPDASNSSLPVDVSAELSAAGAIVCREVDDMLSELGRRARAG